MANFSKIGETSRILVRTWTDTDADSWFRLSQDEGIDKFSLSGYRLSDVNASKAMIKTWAESFGKTQLGVLPVILKTTSEIIGICALKPAKLDDEATEQIEIMYRLGQKYWKQGFATEAGNILLRYGFGQLDLPSIIGFILPENTPSKGVLLRLGMEFQRNSSFSKHSVELYRIQKRDFLKKYESGKIEKTVLDIGREVLAIAKNGLTFCKDPFDIERFRQLEGIAADLISKHSDHAKEYLGKIFSVEEGYNTPKLDVRGAVFKDNRILMVKERSGGWTLPGGFVDVNESLSEAPSFHLASSLYPICELFAPWTKRN